jgi:small-conductance mechanosensitive channel
VIFDDFGDNSLMFEVNFWINSTVEGGLRVMRSNIRFEIDELFNQHGIVISYPQRDVHVDGSLILKREPRKAV